MISRGRTRLGPLARRVFSPSPNRGAGARHALPLVRASESLQAVEQARPAGLASGWRFRLRASAVIVQRWLALRQKQRYGLFEKQALVVLRVSLCCCLSSP